MKPNLAVAYAVKKKQQKPANPTAPRSVSQEDLEEPSEPLLKSGSIVKDILAKRMNKGGLVKEEAGEDEFNFEEPEHDEDDLESLFQEAEEPQAKPSRVAKIMQSLSER